MEILNGPGKANSTIPYWGWIMLTAKPTIFKQK